VTLGTFADNGRLFRAEREWVSTFFDPAGQTIGNLLNINRHGTVTLAESRVTGALTINAGNGLFLAGYNLDVSAATFSTTEPWGLRDRNHPSALRTPVPGTVEYNGARTSRG